MLEVRIPSFLLEKKERLDSENRKVVYLKRKRKSKKEITGRDFSCSICKKGYLSYPALYTHRRNKHNIIPITGKPEFFKSNPANPLTKFRYNALETTNDVRGIIGTIISIYRNLSEKYFLSNDSFLQKIYDVEDDKLISLLKYYQEHRMERPKIPKFEEEGDYIDNILAVYLILILEVTREKFYAELIVKFVFLFREYINVFGWEHKKFLHEYGLNDNLVIEGEYCQQNNCEEVPELVNDFIASFLELDPSFQDGDIKDMSDICQNFCYWLLINGLTCFKLSKIEAYSN